MRGMGAAGRAMLWSGPAEKSKATVQSRGDMSSKSRVSTSKAMETRKYAALGPAKAGRSRAKQAKPSKATGKTSYEPPGHS